MYDLAVNGAKKHWWDSDKSDGKEIARLKKVIDPNKLKKESYTSFPTLLELLVLLNKISIGSKKPGWGGLNKKDLK